MILKQRGDKMKKTLLMVSSVTYAIKARDLLTSHGYRSYIETTPGHLDKVGCGYSVSVTADADNAERLLIENGIKVLGRVDKNDIS